MTDDKKEGKKVIVASQQWAGPLPPPDALAAYDRIHPGSAEAILHAMMEEGAHRRQMERFEMEQQWAAENRQIDLNRQALDASAKQYARGQWIAGILGVMGIGGGIACAISGQETAGIAAIVTAIAGLAAAFILGRNIEKRDRDSSREVTSSSAPPSA